MTLGVLAKISFTSIAFLSIACSRAFDCFIKLVVLPLGSLTACAIVLSCGAEKNDNFSISLEETQTVMGIRNLEPPVLCNAQTQLGCGRMDVVTENGEALQQRDVSVSCTATVDGDLNVELKANPEPSRIAVAQFRVHRNSAPEGTAQCAGLVADQTSETGFARSSCDVIVRFGTEVFAATRFEPCSANITSSDTVQGSISCPLLRAGKRSLIVNALSFYCLREPKNTGNGNLGTRLRGVP